MQWWYGLSLLLLCLSVFPRTHEHFQERYIPCCPRFALRRTPGVQPCHQGRSTLAPHYHFPEKQAPSLSGHQKWEHVAGCKAAGVPWEYLGRSRPHPVTQIRRVPSGFGICALARRCGGWCSLQPQQKNPSHHSMSLLTQHLQGGWSSIFERRGGEQECVRVATSHCSITR